MSLTLYKKKRNFLKTPEPDTDKNLTKNALTFVVQKHYASHLHYDFRLELNGVLKSWAVPKGPSMNPADKRLAVHVEDHPIDYSNFYGEIPAGNYGAGTVEIWDNGNYIPAGKSNSQNPDSLLYSDYKKGNLKFILNGHYLKCEFALVKMNSEEGKNWLLIKKKDKYSLNKFEINEVLSLKSFKKSKSSDKKTESPLIKKPSKKQSKKISLSKSNGAGSIKDSWQILKKPMLAKLSSNTIIDDKELIYEIKFDGYRGISKVCKDGVILSSRNGQKLNLTYSPIIKDLNKISDQVILDGEITVLNGKGIPSFSLLQNYKDSDKNKLRYYVFDILFLNGFDLTELSLENRKEILDDFFEKYRFKNIVKSKYIKENGKDFFKKMTAKGYEGIVSKELSGKYLPNKRSETWLKYKSIINEEAYICGYFVSESSRKYFSSLILGLKQNNKIVYTGNCGTGFTENTSKVLFQKFSKLKAKKSPFSKNTKINRSLGKPVWLKPDLKCKVKFSEWTNNHMMRHPVFEGLVDNSIKTDSVNKNIKSKNAKDFFIKSNGKRVKITNPDKLYWKEEKITKGDIVNYYNDISKYILPYLKNRPESLNRHPNGIDAPGFYQKDMDLKNLPEWIKTVKIGSSSNKKEIDYLICNNAATLLYMANLGCIEMNPWNSKIKSAERPDYLILDLDPGNIDFRYVIKTALKIKELCDKISINSYCKTSGASGLHVFIPLNGKYDYDKTRSFAKLLAEVVNSELPDITSTERSVKKRKNKVYIDYLQNSKGQTIAAPYCVRPRKGATVSTPLKWEEVNKDLSPENFNIFNMKLRLEKMGDLWKPVLGKGISMMSAIKNLLKHYDLD
ncbi:MAG TPA: DNA ligase D [Ignavibacteria bacterium]|nr:DNA ligase D [Ignavibacteria bacterium]